MIKKMALLLPGHRLTGVALLAAFIAAPVLAADQDILIRNVRLFDREGEVEDVVANLLIREGRLKLVTKDHIPRSEADLAFDAQEGVLLGNLDLGELAGFIILDQDPRENVEALLDTAVHGVFAIVRGEVVRNNLPTVAEAEDEDEGRGWLAYTPPPIALPLSYSDTKKWNRFQTKPVSGLFVAALMIDRQRWLSQDTESEAQVGDLADFSKGEIRGFRVGLIGTLNFKKPWVYTVFGATTAFDRGFDEVKDGGFTMFDYRLDIPLYHHTTMSIGKQKEPISMERLTGGLFLPIFERSSVSDALMPSRNIGIVFNGNTLNRRVAWAAGGFNDWIESGLDFNESTKQAVGRVTGLPFVNEDDSSLLHLGLGVRYSDAEEGLRYRTKPEFNLAPDFVTTVDATDTGLFPADSATTWVLEASLRRGPYLLGSEFVRNEVAAPAFGDPVFEGYHVTASWVVTGEMRAYNRRSAVFGPVPVSRSVNEGGWGALELGLRWSDLDLRDAAIDGGEMKILAFSANWFLTPQFIVATQYRAIELDRFGLVGTSDGMLTRVSLLLE